jgi:hypothetical protein
VALGDTTLAISHNALELPVEENFNRIHKTLQTFSNIRIKRSEKQDISKHYGIVSTLESVGIFIKCKCDELS